MHWCIHMIQIQIVYYLNFDKTKFQNMAKYILNTILVTGIYHLKWINATAKTPLLNDMNYSQPWSFTLLLVNGLFSCIN